MSVPPRHVAEKGVVPGEGRESDAKRQGGAGEGRGHRDAAKVQQIHVVRVSLELMPVDVVQKTCCICVVLESGSLWKPANVPSLGRLLAEGIEGMTDHFARTFS